MKSIQSILSNGVVSLGTYNIITHEYFMFNSLLIECVYECVYECVFQRTMRKANICFKGIPNGIIHLHSVRGRGWKYANDILQNKIQVVNTGERYETWYEIKIGYISRHVIVFILA